jgi:hypothetical protein
MRASTSGGLLHSGRGQIAIRESLIRGHIEAYHPRGRGGSYGPCAIPGNVRRAVELMERGAHHPLITGVPRPYWRLPLAIGLAAHARSGRRTTSTILWEICSAHWRARP